MTKRQLTIILISLAVADLLGAIDATGINIALPTITKDLNVPIIISQWIPNAYTVVLVSTLILMGRLGDIVGAKRLYLIGLIIFGCASIALGFINSAYPLIIIRGLQGLGTAILYTMPMAIIAHLWREREKAFAVTASFFAAGMLIGPLIGGLLTGINLGNYSGWHLIFLLNIPFIIFALFVAQKYIPKLPSKRERIDYLSAFLLLVSFTIIILSLTVINHYYLILGALVLIMLYLYERRLKSALVDFSMFKNKTFLSANMVSFFAMVSIIGMSFVLTFYLQDILGWNSINAGLAFLPVPIATSIAAIIGGKIKNWKLGGFLSSGLILIGIVLLTQINPNISYFTLVLPGIIAISAGSGILMTVIFAAILGSVPTDKSGSASGILNTLQQLGSLIGIALIAAIVLDYSNAFYVLAIAAFLGLLSAFFIKNSAKESKI